MEAQKVSLMFKALSDETRVKIIMELMDGEKCACDLTKDLHLTQPTLAHHTQILCASGLVVSRRIGRWTHFALSIQGMAEAQKITMQLFKSSQRDPFISADCC